MTDKSWSPSQNCFKEAFRRNQFSLVFQPQVRLADNVICGAEVLVRWNHPEHGVLLPNRFLPLLAQTTFDWLLDDLVLFQTMQAQVALQAEGLRLPLSINLSPHQLLNPGFSDMLDEAADLFPEVPLSSLEFELLESEPLVDIEAAAIAMRNAQRRGVRFALDDFGVGHASLLHCHRLPLQKLKIDKSFIGPMLEGELFATLVQRAVELGHSMGFEVLAEGVESPAQQERLRQMGCDQGQGYLFARPMPQAAFIDWLKAQRLAD